MIKKKTKRVESRQGFSDKFTERWRRFQSSGAVVTLLFLFVYIAATSALVSVDFAPGLESGDLIHFKDILQMTGLISLLSLILVLYIANYESRLIVQHLQFASIVSLLLLMTILAKIIAYLGWSPYLIGVPVMITAIIINIAYSQRFAVGIGAFMTLIGVITLERQLDFLVEFSILLSTGSAMFVTVTCLREIRTRSSLIQACCLAGVVLFAMVWFMEFWYNMRPDLVMTDSLYGMFGAILVGFFMQGILPLVERVFQTATSMRLLDYSEASRPLLQRLAVEAPGTFHHSWQIGMLAEAAADTIGANGLLCRVGSYYHDIGKINKPHFFVENQGESFSQHKGLSPTMSKMIIIGHVKDGLEMAQEYRLPKVLLQFIATHHGTTLVEYFYHEATKGEKENGLSFNEADFRYPGPKPQNKETAIVMLCDAIEGATRALADPTPSRIEGIVNTLLMKRLLDGQFDECNITMRELRLIENRLVSTLCGMYHGRIAYPNTDAKAKLKDASIAERPKVPVGQNP